MLVAMGVFAWLAFTSRAEPGIGRVAGGRPANTAPNPIPEERYEQLAAFEAPAYAAQRGEPKSFQIAMARHAKQDYAGAASALRAVSDVSPGFPAVRFYLGVSLLLAGNRIAGIQELRDLAMAGDSPYLERARFYLAKGLIAEHDIQRAERQLEDLIGQHGGLEKQATVLLSQIRAST